MAAAGVARERSSSAGTASPSPDDVPPSDGSLRRALGVPTSARSSSTSGGSPPRRASSTSSRPRGAPRRPLVLLGPDDRHGTSEPLPPAMTEPATAGRVHRLPPTAGPPLDLYRRGDVFVLASGGENFGLVAAEAAAVGHARDRVRPLRDRVVLRAGEALVVSYDRARRRSPRSHACLGDAGAPRAALSRRRARGGAAQDVGARGGDPGGDLRGGARARRSRERARPNQVLDARARSPSRP